MSKILGYMLGSVVAFGLASANASQSCIEKNFDFSDSAAGSTIRIDEFYLVIPKYMELLSFGLDPDYEKVVALRYGPKSAGAEIVSIVIRKSSDRQDWKVLPDSSRVEPGNLVVNEGWHLREAANLPSSDYGIAVLYNEHYEVKVIGRQPTVELGQMIFNLPDSK